MFHFFDLMMQSQSNTAINDTSFNKFKSRTANTDAGHLSIQCVSISSQPTRNRKWNFDLILFNKIVIFRQLFSLTLESDWNKAAINFTFVFQNARSWLHYFWRLKNLIQLEFCIDRADSKYDSFKILPGLKEE